MYVSRAVLVWLCVAFLGLVGTPARGEPKTRNYTWPPRGTTSIGRHIACDTRRPSQRAVVRQKQGGLVTIRRTVFLRSRNDLSKAPPSLRGALASNRKLLDRCFRSLQPGPSPTPCAISIAGPESVSIISGAEREMVVSTSATCATPTELRISGYPAGGHASLVGERLTYSTHATDGSGHDAIALVACTMPTASSPSVCSAEKTIAINRCAITVSTTESSVEENSASTISLGVESSCGSPPTIELVTLPTLGVASPLSSASVRYAVGFASGSDSFAIRACDTNGAGCGSPQTITLTIRPGPDFQGRPDSLAPYREHISVGEREHLVRKLANNRFDLIAGSGAELPLLELIRTRFLDEALVSPDLKSTLAAVQSRGLLYGRPIATEEFIPNWSTDFDPAAACPPSTERGAPAPGPCFQPIVPAALDLNAPENLQFAIERWMMTTDRSWHADNFRYHWGYHLTTSRYLKRARYLAPLHTKMWQFWSGHFGTNTQIINGFQENLVGYYISTIEREAFGNFRAMMLGRPGGADENGCAPLTPWKQNHGSILCDAASNLWLSNDKNEGKNQDFARELLELYLLSPVDEFTNTPNYSDTTDIVAGARFVSGIRVNPVKNLVPGSAPLYAPAFDTSKHDATPSSMFTGEAGLSSNIALVDASFEPGDLVRHLFDHNPALPRFIAGKIFATFVYPDPSEALVAELGDELKRLDFDLRAFLELILTSEAMFSPRAAGKNCVSSPLEVYSRIINTVGLPMLPLKHAPEAEATYLYAVDGNLNGAGENILGYPTVFGYDYCGRAPGIDGSSAWLFSHLMIARVSNFTRFLNDYTAAVASQYDLQETLGIITAEPEFADGSPESIINFFADRFDMTLDRSERSILLEYLTNRRSSAGTLQPVVWLTTDAALMREKIAGLMVILSAFEQSATQ